ncbi:MAG: PAS domain S-box protein, partial [Deltaproteobacteria bacterium]
MRSREAGMWDVPRMLRALSGRAPEVESLRQQLGVAEGRLRAVFESSVIGVIVGDLDGAIREANDAFLWMVGCSREDLEAGRLNWIELTPPEHRSLDASAIGRLQRRRAYSPFEKEYLRRDGSRIPVLIIGMALLGDAGDQCIALALPLIERRASAEVLRASEARLTGIIGSVTDAIITIDAERRIVVFNAAAERMLRCSAAEALGQKIDRFV